MSLYFAKFHSSKCPFLWKFCTKDAGIASCVIFLTLRKLNPLVTALLKFQMNVMVVTTLEQYVLMIKVLAGLFVFQIRIFKICCMNGTYLVMK